MDNSPASSHSSEPHPTRRTFVRGASALTTGAALAGIGSAPRGKAQRAQNASAASDGTRPNLVFIFPDQMRAHAQGYMSKAPYADAIAGSDDVNTPQLDAFAAQSTVLTQAVATYPVCSPYRAMLMSGRFPHRNTVGGNILSNNPWELQDDQTCFTDVLAQSGYDVGYIGKWHLTRPVEPYLPQEAAPAYGGGIWNEWTPPERRHGINHWCAYNTFDVHMDPLYWEDQAPRDGWIRPKQWGPIFETDRAISYLRNANGERSDDRPFALFVSMNPPHPPYQALPDTYRDAAPSEAWLNRPNVHTDHRASREAADGYFAMCSGVDDQLGRILRELDAQNLAEDTLVVFTSDHGEMMGSHGMMQKNTWQEESMRVPLVMRLPGQLQAGVADDLLMDTPDLTATLIGLMGLTPSDEWQGRDLSNHLTGTDAGSTRPEAQLYLKNISGIRGLRTDRYTLVLHNPEYALRPPGPAARPGILSDRREDPYQLNNHFQSEEALVEDLTEQLVARLEAIGDPWRPAG